ncbi:MAG: thiamine-phosphate kinase [Thermoanaerobaculia bacterium]
MKTVAELGEKRIIAEIVKPLFFSSAAEQVEVPLGDDCAILRVPDGHSIVVTMDKIPEHLIPFRLGLMTMRQLGRYLLVSSLSDLAAMAAQPLASLLSVCVPSDFSVADLRDLLEGANDAADAFQCPIVGGDTKGATSWSLVSTALGTLPRGQSLKRSAARPGDVICVTGTAGRVGTALAYFLGRHTDVLSSDDEQFLIDGFRAPVPRLAAAQRLRAAGVHACQDISDGIGQTAVEIAAASRLCIELDLDRLDRRVRHCVTKVAGNSHARALDILTGPGADFELMISLPPDRIAAATAALSDVGIDLFPIGGATEGGGAWVRTPTGAKELLSVGFEHLTGRPDDDLVLARQTQTPK